MPARTHGKYQDPVYHVWEQMKQRCLNPKCPIYRNYGARGITICERWLVFEAFFEDMGDPGPKMTLDRIDNNNGYFKANCRWVNNKVQSNNKRTNVVVEFRGETLNLSEWAGKLGIKVNTLVYRHKRGWTAERMLLQPIQQRVYPCGIT